MEFLNDILLIEITGENHKGGKRMHIITQGYFIDISACLGYADKEKSNRIR